MTWWAFEMWETYNRREGGYAEHYLQSVWDPCLFKKPMRLIGTALKHKCSFPTQTRLEHMATARIQKDRTCTALTPNNQSKRWLTSYMWR